MYATKIIIATVTLAFGLALGAGAAGDAGNAPEELKQQTTCPVMGGKIDSTVYTDIQGQRVYHCCPMCSSKLKADPDLYFKKAAAEGVLFENIQTVCPVSGEELDDKSVYTDYEGRRIAFCCKKCRGTFNEDPQEYLSKLDETPGETTGDEMNTDHDMKSDHEKHMDHESHHREGESH